MNSTPQSWIDAVVVAILNSVRGLSLFLPNVIAALLIFLIGWAVAGVLRRVTLHALKLVQLEPFAEKVGLSEALKKVGATLTPSELFGELIKWAVVLLFLSPALEILGLPQVTGLINQILLYIPNVFIAVLIVMVGTIVADLAAHFVHGGASAIGSTTAGALAVFTRYAILIFALLAALSQLGIAQQLIFTLFSGLVAMLAIAGGLAFGLGGKDLAAEILQGIKRSFEEKQ